MKKLNVVELIAEIVLIVGVISTPLINNYSAYKVEKNCVKYRCQGEHN